MELSVPNTACPLPITKKIGIEFANLCKICTELEIEKSISEKFVRRAKKTLKQMSNMKIIGITGSDGKTTTTSMRYLLFNKLRTRL